jgi:uncharacterized protein (TIGR02246 family)
MKKLSLLAGFICLLAMILPACAPPPEPEPEPAPEPVFDQAAEEAAIREIFDDLITTYNKHDAKAYAAIHTEDYEVWDGSIKGREALEKNIADRLARQKDVQAKPLEEIGFVFVTPDVAIHKMRGEAIGLLDADNQPLPPLKLLAARIFVKRNSKWLLAADFFRPIEE